MAIEYRIVFTAIAAIVIVLVSFTSCGEAPKERYSISESELNDLAKLHCEAIGLRNGRFALADTLRGEPITHQDSLEMRALLERKSLIKKETRILADSIEAKMKVIMTWPPKEKQKFLEELAQELRRMGCEEQNAPSS